MSFGMYNSQSPPAQATGSMKEKIPSGYKKGTLQNYTPEQMALHNQQYGFLEPGSYLHRLASGDQSFFDEMEAPAFRQFNELQGNIASRFSANGTGGRNSSGFHNTMNQASSNFAQDLQSKRQDYMRQAINDLMGFSNQILNQKPYENMLVQKQQKPDFWSSIGGAIPGAIAAFASGGVPGALAGGVSSFFGSQKQSPLTGQYDLGFRSGAPGYWQ